MHQTKKRMAQMKPSCCSSISRLLRTFLSRSSMVFGGASGVSSSSIGARAGAEGAASRSVGKRGSLPAASRRRLHVGRAAARREADARGLRSATAKQRGRWSRAGARGGRRRQTGEREGEASLSGAGLSPAPRTHHGRRRRKRRGGAPRSSGSGRPTACRGLRVSTEGRRHPCGSQPAPAKFEVYPFPPSLPPPPAVGGRWV